MNAEFPTRTSVPPRRRWPVNTPTAGTYSRSLVSGSGMVTTPAARRPVRQRILALWWPRFPLDHRCGQFVPELDRRRYHHEGCTSNRCECWPRPKCLWNFNCACSQCAFRWYRHVVSSCGNRWFFW
ncbi:MAG: hypothetical protein R2788_04990 [Saprospiraceae bacterium]